MYVCVYVYLYNQRERERVIELLVNVPRTPSQKVSMQKMMTRTKAWLPSLPLSSSTLQRTI